MANTVVIDKQWEEARDSWESDGNVTYADIARSLGVSRARVSQKSTKEGWQKTVNAEERHALGPHVETGGKPAQSPGQAPMLNAANSEEASAGSRIRIGSHSCPEYQKPGVSVRPGFEHVESRMSFARRPTRPVSAKGTRTVEYLQQRNELLASHKQEQNFHGNKIRLAMKAQDMEEATRLEKLGRAMRDNQDLQLKTLDEQFNGLVTVFNFYRVPGKRYGVPKDEDRALPAPVKQPEKSNEEGNAPA
jgi:hypothetical protein